MYQLYANDSAIRYPHTHTQKLQSRGEIRKKKKENHARRVGKGWIVIQM